MKTQIPKLSDVTDRLKDLSEIQMADLSTKSGVGVSTIWKIRCGYTKNPGVETFRKIVAAMPRRRRTKGTQPMTGVQLRATPAASEASA